MIQLTIILFMTILFVFIVGIDLKDEKDKRKLYEELNEELLKEIKLLKGEEPLSTIDLYNKLEKVFLTIPLKKKETFFNRGKYRFVVSSDIYENYRRGNCLYYKGIEIKEEKLFNQNTIIWVRKNKKNN